METKLVRIFELSSSENNNGDAGRSRVRRFISNMNQYFQHGSKTQILRGFQHWKVRDMEEFDNAVNREYIRADELERLTQHIRMTGIVSLDMSSRSPLPGGYCTLNRAISYMVPNLQELDFSNTTTSNILLEEFALRCPRLEIIRWNYNNTGIGISAAGDRLECMNNLKELYFDNSFFCFNHSNPIDEATDADDDDDDDDNGVTAFEAMVSRNNYPNVFLFHRLCDKPLERISIRNARYTDPDDICNHIIIPQSILMKFVRKAPATLVWFRSDLSPANIRILQSERPGIQFLN